MTAELFGFSKETVYELTAKLVSETNQLIAFCTFMLQKMYGLKNKKQKHKVVY